MSLFTFLGDLVTVSKTKKLRMGENNSEKGRLIVLLSFQLYFAKLYSSVCKQ